MTRLPPRSDRAEIQRVIRRRSTDAGGSKKIEDLTPAWPWPYSHLESERRHDERLKLSLAPLTEADTHEEIIIDEGWSITRWEILAFVVGAGVIVAAWWLS